MRYLIFLGHPAHFHLFKNLVPELETAGHEVIVLTRTKDILEDLCKRSNIKYINVLPEIRKKSVFSIIVSYLRKYRRISKIIRSFKPDILMGSEPSLAHLGKFFGIPSFIFSEDDVAIIPQFAKIAYPFTDVILSPNSCNAGKWDKKKVGYDGFHKLTYLHPSVFKPLRSEIPELGSGDFFILRFAKLVAYHDTDRGGLGTETVRELINILKPYGNIFITSERVLEPEFEVYRLPIDPTKIHHALYFAKMYLGDSQSMAVETALLGTPGIRFNDFAGEIGVLNELEFKYQLTHSYKTNQATEMLNKVSALLNDADTNIKFRERRKKMLGEKINVFKFFSWFIQNYPSSKETMKNNADYQYNFK